MPIDESRPFQPVRIALLTVSDTRTLADDSSGEILAARIADAGHELAAREISRDSKNEIAAHLHRWIDDEMVDCVITTGGTGLTGRDVTPEALEPILERRIPGVEEAIRKYGQDRMPYAMLSRSVAGTLGNCLVLALPGSTNGAKESMDAVFPNLLHVFKILRGAQHNADE